MALIEKNYQVSSLTTMQVGSTVDYFVVVKELSELLEAISWGRDNHQEIFILGGGSNTVFSRSFSGLVIKNEIKGLSYEEQVDGSILVKAKSGESWSELVDYCVGHDWHGIENLALIYGTVGAAPVQNIGAYGVELKDVFYELEAVELTTGKLKVFTATDCAFGYRDSIFKQSLKGRYFIYSLTLRLDKKSPLKLDYGSIREELIKRGKAEPSVKDVAEVVKSIRQSKLPDPLVLPNCGSFFKNVEIDFKTFSSLLADYPEMPSFSLPSGLVKIPTAWLIEQAGFKGRRLGPVSMYEKQALVLVNHGGATSGDILNLIDSVQKAVKNKFGLDIEPEVNIL